MVQSGHNAYKQNAGNVVTSKDQILLKLYEGILNFLSLARRGIEDNNPKVKGENISKILAIISELECALDHTAGGDISQNLSILYQHVMHTLVSVNVNNDIAGLDSAFNIMKDIKEGFEAAAIETRKAQTQQPDQHFGYESDNAQKERMRIAV